MFTLSEKLISSVAPHVCLLCKAEGKAVCDDCLSGLYRPRRSACFMCNALSDDFKTCASCRRKTPLKRVWVATRYEAYVKQLIKQYKFERMRAAHTPLAQLISKTIIAGQYDLVVPVPSVTSRFRKRGYNPADLIAADVAKSLQINKIRALGRHGHARQVGHNRAERLKQLEDTIYSSSSSVSGNSILLIDDVLTTGATLHQCALVLKRAGAKSIEAAVVASS